MTHPSTITITWSIGDVQEVRADLTDAQAYEVLLAVEDDHDANVGINWSILEDFADLLFPLTETE